MWEGNHQIWRLTALRLDLKGETLIQRAAESFRKRLLFVGGGRMVGERIVPLEEDALIRNVQASLEFADEVVELEQVWLRMEIAASRSAAKQIPTALL